MVIAVGGGFVRVWRPRIGLAAEVPACVVVSRDGEVVAIGEDAAGREGKLLPSQQFIRPFFADKIIHRELLRSLVVHSLELASDKGSTPPWERLMVRAVISPTVPRLHADWLVKTFREAGLGWLQRVDPLESLANSATKRAKTAPVIGVVDWGFSAVRAVIYAGDTILTKHRADHLGLLPFCQRVLQLEKESSGRIFPLSGLYGLQWGLAHTGFERKTGRPVSATLSREAVTGAQREFAGDILVMLQQLQQKLSPEQSSFLGQHGWVLSGGGAVTVSDPSVWEKELGVPVRLSTGPTYAAIQSVGG